MNISKQLDKLAKARQAYFASRKETSALEQTYKEQQAKVLAYLNENNLKSTANDTLSVSRVITEIPVVDDKKAVIGYALRTGNMDIVPASVNATGWRELLHADKPELVPGTRRETRISLHITLKG